MYDEKLELPALSSAIDSDAGLINATEDNLEDRRFSEDISIAHNENEARREKGKADTSQSCITQTLTDFRGSCSKPPGLSYIALISMAIQSSNSKKMLLSEIYHWISEKYPYYQMKNKSWRNSIRHNLSLNECFVKRGRSENGKGNYWSIHPANITDFAKGDYRRRRARRQVRKCDEDLQRLCSISPDVDKQSTATSLATSGGQEGYVPMASTLVPANFLSVMGVEPMKSYDYWLSQCAINQESRMLAKPILSVDTDMAKDYSRTDCAYLGKQTAYNYNFHYDRDNSTKTSYPQAEPTLNVNVNVNVCGTADPETSRTDGYQCFDRYGTMSQPKYNQSSWQESYYAASSFIQ